MNKECNCSHFDYYGVLFELIFKHSSDRVWQRFIGKLKENKSNSSEKNIFRLIWETYYSFAFIDQAFSVLIEEAVVFSDETVKMIFYSGKDDSINMLQKSWFIEKMNRDYRNISTMSHVISAVAIICPDYKNELILRFIELNHSIEDFKRLSLFSESYTIVGSEIPFFNDRIHSLEVLCDSMSGANYIEHKAYLQKLIKGYKKQKDEAEIREYLENERY